MKFLFVGVLIGAIVFLTYLASKGPNPVNAARAEEIRLRAEADAADRALALQQQSQLNEIKIQERAARSAQIRQAWATFVKWTGRGLTLFAFSGLAVLLLVWTQYSTGIARAAVANAEKNAALIYVDKETGQLPVILRQTENGHLLETDLNTGQTRLLDVNNEADPQLAAGAIAIRYATTIARLAARTEQGGVSGNIDTPVIFPQVVDLDSLKHLLEQNGNDRSDDNA